MYELIQHRDYGGMKDEMIRDQLIVESMIACFQKITARPTSHTLKKAKKCIHQSEAIHKQQKTQKGNSKPIAECNYNAIQHKQQGNRSCYSQ